MKAREQTKRVATVTWCMVMVFGSAGTAGVGLGARRVSRCKVNAIRDSVVYRFFQTALRFSRKEPMPSLASSVSISSSR